MSLKLDLNFSCSSPAGSKLIIMLPITLRVNCKNIRILSCFPGNSVTVKIKKCST